MIRKEDIFLKLYKPYGVLSQFVSNNEKQTRKKSFLGELYDFPDGIMPVGRLDEKSEGLLLLTTNGKWSDTINQSGIEKEYLAQLDGEITEEAIAKLIQGVEIGFSGKKYITKPCKVQKQIELPEMPLPNAAIRLGRHRPNSWVRIIIKEGKFRQVRKMTAAVGFPTLRLIRVRIGDVYLENMIPGAVAPLDNSTLLEINFSTKESS
ncbi:23S rRNA pseudouridine2457 synthase [Maribacter vaceletii]|uniref:Pseudouridine synthase n=1 Tax=Maribacter vaceletii TaxID=1206816 RepID=A0A495E8Q8_9FLAO|nr:pseudouridine synthase [Maribacter vaceletii]RKR13041.1 23S rRNA pseudouridine2457 synthase [Maribacter vaceletii]